uniref:ABC transporter domain-containing protein n=1 Tax=Grammatophora oceanica TaxID=210454 RepID=A0A7S1URZ1_9STRA
MYAAIKGVPKEEIADATAEKLSEVGLNEFDSDRLSSGYSGGMKRKLSVACATIGNPQIVFLDEPSTGMDPVARRDMWQVISDMVTGGDTPDEERTSVILTTHSMEECEALCSRIGIMANAHLRCIGSAQHLKTRFGKGFQVQMKLADVERTDSDYLETFAKLAQHAGAQSMENMEGGSDDIHLNLEQTAMALQSLTLDNSLSDKLVETDQTGYAVMSAAKSPVGVPLTQVTTFAVSEARIAAVEKFFSDNFEIYVLRERQYNNVRYEIGSTGVKISSIFALIEEKKEVLHCADYGVSQTSLEQVFNMHAAAAEEIKHLGEDEKVARAAAMQPSGEQQMAPVKAVPVKAVPVKAAAAAPPPPREPQYVQGTMSDGASEDGYEA